MATWVSYLLPILLQIKMKLFSCIIKKIFHFNFMNSKFCNYICIFMQKKSFWHWSGYDWKWQIFLVVNIFLCTFLVMKCWNGIKCYKNMKVSGTFKWSGPRIILLCFNYNSIKCGKNIAQRGRPLQSPIFIWLDTTLNPSFLAKVTQNGLFGWFAKLFGIS